MQDMVQMPTENEHIFALDIGTRTVIGIVGKQVDGVFQVIATACQPHEKRAMFDGQIEDIEEVARAARLVKHQLEEQVGFTLRQVCVAAAGRSLRTNKAAYEMAFNPDESIETNQVYQLEMGAIGIAQQEINSDADEDAPAMFCVGYSPTGYWLDDYKMTTIVGHKGKKARVEVIATFLPNQVVESLRSAMSLLELTIINLTLEPIAAMNAVIPSDLRLLNLALVDVGAGTSDIAISNNGSVVAYTMATVAGDEITEAIMKKYLMDFEGAEQVKVAAATGVDPIQYHNILGFEYTVTLAELMETIAPAVDGLAEEIAGRITDSNGGSTAAVFLVGGGSKTPLLPKLIATKLGLDEQKVAVGGSNYMKKQAIGNFDGKDPEYATPIGIAITAASYAKQHSAYVNVNNERVCLMRSAGFNVMNALLMSGFKYNQLMGKSGKSISYVLNGENKLARGGLPQPAQITVNGNPASISTAVENGDNIIILPSVSGTDAVVNTASLRTIGDFAVSVDDVPFYAGELLFVNGRQIETDMELENMDSVKTKRILTLGELCAHYGLPVEDKGYFLGQQVLEGSYELKNGDCIVTKTIADVLEIDEPAGEELLEMSMAQQHSPNNTAAEEIEEAIAYFSQPYEPAVQVDSTTTETSQKTAGDGLHTVESVDATANPSGSFITVTINNQSVQLAPKEGNAPYFFLDMLNFVEIDPTKPQGDIVLKVNSENATYLQEIADGDCVEIYWSPRGL